MGRKFSMIPLWMTTTRPEASRWGWAFSSDGRPWVAQRVWPMPVRPAGGPSSRRKARFPSFPSLRVTLTTPSSPRTAIPAES